MNKLVIAAVGVLGIILIVLVVANTKPAPQQQTNPQQVPAENTQPAQTETTINMQGIHIMPDGSVMDGNGTVLPDARVDTEGNIVLPDGQVVEPAMDLRK